MGLAGWLSLGVLYTVDFIQSDSGKDSVYMSGARAGTSRIPKGRTVISVHVAAVQVAGLAVIMVGYEYLGWQLTRQKL